MQCMRVLIITSSQLSRCCWVRKTNLRATEQSEKFHVRRGGIHRSSVSRIIHKDLRLKLLQEKVRSTADWSAQHARVIFGICSLRDDNVITSKLTWTLKHANSIRESFEYFCQVSSKSIRTTSSYTVSKLGRFLRYNVVIQCAKTTNQIHINTDSGWYWDSTSLACRCRIIGRLMLLVLLAWQ